MQLTIASIISDEMTRCLQEYKRLAEQEHKDALNNRYLCLQTALWMAQGGKSPAIRMPEDQVRAVIRQWQKDIQRDSTVATMHHDGRVVAILQEFLDDTKPITAAPAQTKLV